MTQTDKAETKTETGKYKILQQKKLNSRSYMLHVIFNDKSWILGPRFSKPMAVNTQCRWIKICNSWVFTLTGAKKVEKQSHTISVAIIKPIRDDSVLRWSEHKTMSEHCETLLCFSLRKIRHWLQELRRFLTHRATKINSLELSGFILDY